MGRWEDGETQEQKAVGSRPKKNQGDERIMDDALNYVEFRATLHPTWCRVDEGRLTMDAKPKQ